MGTDRTISGSTNPGQIGPGSNDNVQVNNIHHYLRTAFSPSEAVYCYTQQMKFWRRGTFLWEIH